MRRGGGRGDGLECWDRENPEKLCRNLWGCVLAVARSVGLDLLEAEPLVQDSSAARNSRQN